MCGGVHCEQSSKDFEKKQPCNLLADTGRVGRKRNIADADECHSEITVYRTWGPGEGVKCKVFLGDVI